VNQISDTPTPRSGARTPPPHGQVLGGSIPRKFPTGSPRITMPCGSQKSHVSCFSGEFIIFECYLTQETPKSCSTALSATKSLHMGLYVHICTCECATGSLTTTTTAAREHYCTELLLLAGRGAHKTHKHAAGHCLRDNLITWASMFISALLNVPLGALLHMSGCGHMVCYGRIIRSPCVAAARYPICQRPLSDAC